MDIQDQIPPSLKKYDEAEYFLKVAIENYHNPNEFQFNLNAFIQAFRNITFMLQSEKDKPVGFDEWYTKKQEEMRNHEILRKFVNARNIVVKNDTLSHRSKVQVGLFRGRKMKLSYNHDINPMTDTKEVLEIGKSHFIGFILDKDHSAIGEQIGVERTWIVEELGDKEVISICFEALKFMKKMLFEFINLYGVNTKFEDCNLNLPEIQVLLETDLNPKLVKKWHWD